MAGKYMFKDDGYDHIDYLTLLDIATEIDKLNRE